MKITTNLEFSFGITLWLSWCLSCGMVKTHISPSVVRLMASVST